MDLLLDVLDPWLLDGMYDRLSDPPLARDGYLRQSLSLFLLFTLGGFGLYFVGASISYAVFFVWKRDVYYPVDQPQPKDGQVWREIKLSMIAAPFLALLTIPVILPELHGYSKLYDDMSDYSYAYFGVSILLFLVFTDSSIYWIHRWLHTFPFLYKHIHKPHHQWIVPTPFAAIAFHPVDGWLQSLPYHIFPFLFPLHKKLYLTLFVLVQLWTISIHDGVDFAPPAWINGSGHHYLHHTKFKYNYGQYFKFWDVWGGSYMPCEPRSISQLDAANGTEKKKSK